jgi:hypothetical protein
MVQKFYIGSDFKFYVSGNGNTKLRFYLCSLGRDTLFFFCLFSIILWRHIKYVNILDVARCQDHCAASVETDLALVIDNVHDRGYIGFFAIADGLFARK